jgi:hypothetical protein
MAFTSRAKLGPYEILLPLGAGSIGKLYRTHEARLAHKVESVSSCTVGLGDRIHCGRANGTPIMKWSSISAGRVPRILRYQPDVKLNFNFVFGSDASFSRRLDPEVSLLHDGLAGVTAVF